MIELIILGGLLLAALKNSPTASAPPPPAAPKTATTPPAPALAMNPDDIGNGYSNTASAFYDQAPDSTLVAITPAPVSQVYQGQTVAALNSSQPMTQAQSIAAPNSSQPMTQAQSIAAWAAMVAQAAANKAAQAAASQAAQSNWAAVQGPQTNATALAAQKQVQTEIAQGK